MLQTIKPQTGEIDALTEAEQADLNRCESQIAQGYHTFIEVGAALIEIRDKKLYRAQAETFADYIETRWQISRQRAYQLISAGLMSTRVDIENEAQGRILKRLPEELQPVAWEVAKENSHRIAPNKPVSTRLLKATVNALSDAQATGGYVDLGDGEMTALDAAITQDAHETVKRQSQHIRQSTEKKTGHDQDDCYEGSVRIVSTTPAHGLVTLCFPELSKATRQGLIVYVIAYVSKEEPLS